VSVETIQKLRNGIFIYDELNARMYRILNRYFQDKDVPIERVEWFCESSTSNNCPPGFGKKSLAELKRYLTYLRKEQKKILERDLAKVNCVLNHD
jgi:hypothetical protein